jgi:hypothetical protein
VQQLAVGAYHLEPGDVVAGQPELSRQPPHPTPSVRPPTPVWETLPAVVASPYSLGDPIQGAQQRAAGHPSATPVGVDTDRTQRR